MTTDTAPQTLQQQIAERFARDTAEHTLTILRNEGLYRHLRCAKPGTGIWSFEVITWPGALVVRGDFGPARVFRRIDDMFAFFRSDAGRINPTYWSEKLDGGSRASAVEHSEDVARSLITECLDEYETDHYPHLLDRYKQRAIPAKPTPPAEVRELVAEYDDGGDLAFPERARDLLRELEQLGVTADTWEWDLRDWDWTFLWACHAIVWAIAQYDKAEQTTTTPAAGSDINLHTWCSRIADAYRDYEQHELAMYPDADSRDTAIVEWVVRVLGNPEQAASRDVLAALAARHHDEMAPNGTAAWLKQQVAELTAEVDRLGMFEKRYFEVQELLDEVLGPDEEDGTGEGIVQEVHLVAQQRDDARAEVDRLREQAYAVQPVLDAVQAWAELVETDGSAPDHASALVTLHQAVEQYRLMDLALTTARAEAVAR